MDVRHHNLIWREEVASIYLRLLLGRIQTACFLWESEHG